MYLKEIDSHEKASVTQAYLVHVPEIKVIFTWEKFKRQEKKKKNVLQGNT